MGNFSIISSYSDKVEHRLVERYNLMIVYAKIRFNIGIQIC